MTLDGVKPRRIRYTKRDPGEVAALRREFNNTVRKEFVKHLAADPDRIAKLKAAGLDDLDIQDLKEGVQPAAYQVHHKLPLEDGGTNDFSNLILIKQHPHHKVITNAQNTMIKGVRPGELLERSHVADPEASRPAWPPHAAGNRERREVPSNHPVLAAGTLLIATGRLDGGHRGRKSLS